jgi:hypothetical protein
MPLRIDGEVICRASTEEWIIAPPDWSSLNAHVA